MNQKDFAPVIILLIVASVLIIRGIWYYETRPQPSRSQQNQAVSVAPIGTTTGAIPLTNTTTRRASASSQIGGFPQNSSAASTPGTITAATDKSNWKSYTNAVWGFSIEYPASYTLEEEGLTDATNSFSQGGLLQITDHPDAPDGSGAEFDISLANQPLANNGPVYTDIDSLLAYDQSEAAENYAQAEEIYKKVRTNGTDAIQSFDYNISGDSLGPAAQGYDFLGNNTVIYSLSWSPPTYGFFSEIASTFKFLSR